LGKKKKGVKKMKSHWLVLAVLFVFIASFTACATKDDDLKRLETQIQQAMQKAEQASKDSAAVKTVVQDCSRYAEQASAAAARAEAAAKQAEDNAKKSEAIFTKALKK
jgi:septal ring factor EnvC (AmiA/AmiB activator)